MRLAQRKLISFCITGLFLTLSAIGPLAGAAELRVGPKEKLKVPSAAAEVARDGDTIEIAAGTYSHDAAIWKQDRLTIRGVGGRAHLRADGAEAEGKALWVIKGKDTTVENIEFSGVEVEDTNGVGIRLEGGGRTTIRNCYFHDNQGGILTSNNKQSDLVIEHSEFTHNWLKDGHNHNIYVGNIRSFTLRFSYVHHAVIGHNVKSRAQKNFIMYNRVMDEKDGSSSYSIEFPNGGLAFVIGNLIQQGPETDNPTVVSFGAEGLSNPVNRLYFVSNTVVDDLPSGGRFIFVKDGAEKALIENNVFSGRGPVLVGPGETRNNVIARRSDFVDPNNFDYRLKSGAAAIGRAIDPGSVEGFDLHPDAEYVHKAQKRERRTTGKLDAGALEYRP